MKKVNKIIALFMGFSISPYPNTPNKLYKDNYSIHIDDFKYHTSWDELIPVWKKCNHIGLWMMTHGHEKLWLEKSNEIENAIIREFNIKRSATLISQLITWYNSQPHE